MGCAQSRIENEEGVARCRERRQCMKSAAAARNALAAAHSAYVLALKDTGAALSEFAHAHAEDAAAAAGDGVGANDAAASAAAAVNGDDVSAGPGGASGVSGGGGIAVLPPPPPPLPDFSPSPAKIHRSISLPTQIPPAKPTLTPSPLGRDTIREEDEEMAEDEEEREDIGRLDHRRRHRRHSRSLKEKEESPATPPPPIPPSKAGIDTTWDYFFSMDESRMPSLAPEDEVEGMIEEEDEEETFPDVEPYTPPAPPPRPPPMSEEEEDEEVYQEPVTPEPAPLELTPPSSRKQKQKAAAVHHQHTASAPSDVRLGAANKTASSRPGLPAVSILKVIEQIDDRFLKASESASEVSKALEANRMHYHSNFADNRGHIDHSARVMKIITWNRSFKGLNNGDGGQDDFDNDESETLATVIDKMLAWEKKLYDEVKAGEIMKMEYQRKVALLNKQKRSGANVEVLEKTKAAVSHLHTRYIVDMQSMDSTVSEIQHLRDFQLYPRLVDLADRMARMWEFMHLHHESQLNIVSSLKSLEGFSSTDESISRHHRRAFETSEHHHKRTLQLRDVVKEWSTQFCSFMTHQKEFVSSLNSWLKLNLISIECSLKEKPSSPPRLPDPPIKALLQSWHEQLEKLSDEIARNAILSFLAVLNNILDLQKDEMKQKERCEETEREYQRKSRAFEEWHLKYLHRRAGMADEHEPGDGTGAKDPISERKFVVDSLKSKLDDEIEACGKLSKQVQEKSFTVLKIHLPELFRAICDFARASSTIYSQLRLSVL